MRRFTAQVHTMPLEGCVRALFFFLREREIHTTDETYALKVKITQGTRSHSKVHVTHRIMHMGDCCVRHLDEPGARTTAMRATHLTAHGG